MLNLETPDLTRSLYSLTTIRTGMAALVLCQAAMVQAETPEITGTDGNDRLVGTPATDYFRGGPGADVFVINHLSASPDVIADFDPDEGDTVELAFASERQRPFQQENFSVDRKGVVKIKFGNQQKEVVKLNRSDLSLKLDPRKGRYFLKFSKTF